MNEKERKLLFADLCGRLPYGVMCNVFNGKYDEDMKLSPSLLSWDSNDIKPYLRPMGDMTEEEKEEWYWVQRNTIQVDYGEEGDEKTIDMPYLEVLIDWLNKHHFDYRGLIEKGLALEAPKDMYKF